MAYASSGMGASNHLAAELLKKMAGICLAGAARSAPNGRSPFVEELQKDANP